MGWIKSKLFCIAALSLIFLGGIGIHALDTFLDLHEV